MWVSLSCTHLTAHHIVSHPIQNEHINVIGRVGQRPSVLRKPTHWTCTKIWIKLKPSVCVRSSVCVQSTSIVPTILRLSNYWTLGFNFSLITKMFLILSEFVWFVNLWTIRSALEFNFLLITKMIQILWEFVIFINLREFPSE